MSTAAAAAATTAAAAAARVARDCDTRGANVFKFQTIAPGGERKEVLVVIATILTVLKLKR